MQLNHHLISEQTDKHIRRRINQILSIPEQEMKNRSDPPFAPSTNNLQMALPAGGTLLGLELCGPEG
jgi:hypothetical protein